MRTVCLVIASIFLAVASAGLSQDRDAVADTETPQQDTLSPGSVDREITVKGRDDTALPVPAPAALENVSVPDLDVRRPEVPSLPPIAPPAGVQAAPLPEWRVRDPIGAPAS